MNNLDKDIAEIVGEISKVAILINIQGKHHVFINDSGHVQQLDIKIYKNGWEPNANVTLSQSIYYYPDDDFTNEEKIEFGKDTLKALKVIRDTLYKFLKNGSVSIKDRSYEVEEIKHYKFY